MNKKNICFSLSFLLLTSCSSKDNTSYTYKTVQENHMFFDDVFKSYEERYFVLFYSSYCSHCLMIEEEFVKWDVKSDAVVYYVEIQDSSYICQLNGQYFVGDNVDDFCIVGTPELIKIYAKEIQQIFIGEFQILSFIQKSK